MIGVSLCCSEQCVGTVIYKERLTCVLVDFVRDHALPLTRSDACHGLRVVAWVRVVISLLPMMSAESMGSATTPTLSFAYYLGLLLFSKNLNIKRMDCYFLNPIEFLL